MLVILHELSVTHALIQKQYTPGYHDLLRLPLLPLTFSLILLSPSSFVSNPLLSPLSPSVYSRDLCVISLSFPQFYLNSSHTSVLSLLSICPSSVSHSCLFLSLFYLLSSSCSPVSTHFIFLCRHSFSSFPLTSASIFLPSPVCLQVLSPKKFIVRL